MSVLVSVLLVSLSQAGASSVEALATDNAALSAALQGVTSDLLTAEVRATGAVACVLLDHGSGPRSPDASFMTRLAHLPFIRNGSECQLQPEGVIEIASGAIAFLITAGPVRWVASDEAHVSVVFRYEGSHTTARLYRVVQETWGWVSVGQIIEMSPALRTGVDP